MKQYTENLLLAEDLDSETKIESELIKKYIKNTDCDIVQIGSNNGITGDPIFHLALKKSKWKVLLVEPVRYLFEILKSNYPNNSRFRFDNVAINDGSKQVFYYVNKEANKKLETLPNWYDQLGSFDKTHIIKHLDGILLPFIEEIEIKGVTLGQLFETNNINNLELLHIDTEGYDWKVLSQLNLKKHTPIIILFEHEHLQDIEKEEAVSNFENDYQIIEFERDFLFIRKDKISIRALNRIRKKINALPKRVDKPWKPIQ
jgi:FkbM family methyltransferase